MFPKKAFITLMIGILLVMSSVIVSASKSIDQHGVLAGQVVSHVTPGTAVHEGDILVNVNTLAGARAAARATADGVVSEVFVHTGDMVRINQVVARIKTGK